MTGPAAPPAPAAVTVSLRTRAPVLLWVTPARVARAGDPVRVATVGADAGRLTLVDPTGAEVDLGAVVDGGLLVGRVPGAGYTGGRGVIRAEARDDHGNLAVLEHSVLLDPPEPFLAYALVQPVYDVHTSGERPFDASAGATRESPPWSVTMLAESDGYLVGETVFLRVRASVPGTATPAEPAGVELRALVRRGGAAVAMSGDFARVSTGLYALAVDTQALEAGIYDWVAALLDDDGNVALAQGSFPLLDPPS